MLELSFGFCLFYVYNGILKIGKLVLIPFMFFKVRCIASRIECSVLAVLGIDVCGTSAVESRL